LYKAVLDDRVKPQIIHAFDMVIGEIGVIQDTTTNLNISYIGEIVLRTYDGLVSLTNPQHTWAFRRAALSPDVCVIPNAVVTLTGGGIVS
jgi:hypothetical protein